MTIRLMRVSIGMLGTGVAFRRSLWMILAFAVSLGAQPKLRITSPVDGTVVNPGQSLRTVVETSAGFKDVAVICEGPIGTTDLLHSPPYEWTIEIPIETQPGRYLMTAVGFGATPQLENSIAITLTVEQPAGAIIRLEAQSEEMLLHPGDHLSRVIWGFLPDGRRVYLTKSTLISFASKAPDVATVKEEGEVTAVAPGSTVIVDKYRDLRLEIPVKVIPAGQRLDQ